ncbi:MAG: CAP domain-containing protein [Terriglobales bacterium]
MLRALVVAFALSAAVPGSGVAQTAFSGASTADNRESEVRSQPVPGAEVGRIEFVPDQKATPSGNPAARASSGEDSAAESELLRAVNRSRELAGSPPLLWDESLGEAARAHALRMVASARLEHRLPGEPSLLERIAEAGGQDDALKIDRAGENIAQASCPQGAIDVLMGSTAHRRNLLDRNFNRAGIVAIWSKGRLYVVEDLAHQVPTYSAEQSRHLVGQAIDQIRHQADLPLLAEREPANLDQAACNLATESRPSARSLAAAYDNRRVIAYTQSRPELLPASAQSLLRDPAARQFAVGACYRRNLAYPTGTYWIAILLY